jgi:hypothetical protein
MGSAGLSLTIGSAVVSVADEIDTDSTARNSIPTCPTSAAPSTVLASSIALRSAMALRPQLVAQQLLATFCYQLVTNC